jgi:transcriptional regulator with XRE-family HTH domain
MTGEEMKLLREKAGLTRLEMAEKMGLVGTAPHRLQQRIYDFESGRRNIGPQMGTLIEMILEEETEQALEKPSS